MVLVASIAANCLALMRPRAKFRFPSFRHYINFQSIEVGTPNCKTYTTFHWRIRAASRIWIPTALIPQAINHHPIDMSWCWATSKGWTCAWIVVVTCVSWVTTIIKNSPERTNLSKRVIVSWTDGCYQLNGRRSGEKNSREVHFEDD
jgi:hypothetical protein